MSNTTCQVTYFSYYQMLLQPVDLPVLVRGDYAMLTRTRAGSSANWQNFARSNQFI